MRRLEVKPNKPKENTISSSPAPVPVVQLVVNCVGDSQRRICFSGCVLKINVIHICSMPSKHQCQVAAP